MRYLVCKTITALALVACGGSQATESSAPAAEPEAASGAESTTSSAPEPATATESASAGDADEGKPNEFVVRTSESTNGSATKASNIKGNATEAALKFIVVDKDKGPIRGIVISLTAPEGAKYYTEETDADGYAEVLVPVGKKYEVVYLSLGRKDIAASLPVSDEPNQNIKLTLRYKRHDPPPRAKPTAPEPGLVLEGVEFDTGKATIRSDSFPQLDGVAEYLLHKKSARIEISGHTDNVGNPKVNKALSEKRAQACRDYLVAKGIEQGRIQAVGYGDERPIASNDTEEGRQQNRRIEAIEL